MSNIFIDFGTSSVKAIYECNSSSSVEFSNPQKKYGKDIVTRLDNFFYEGKKQLIINQGLESIKKVINHFGDTECPVYVVGNTGIVSIFADENIEKLILSPHVNPIKKDFQIDASSFTDGILNNKIMFPAPLAGFIGSDALSNILWMSSLNQPSILVDIGTNIEVIFSNNNQFLYTSVSGGPAFEDDHISFARDWKKMDIDFNIFDTENSNSNDKEYNKVHATEIFSIIRYMIDKNLISTSGRFPTGKTDCTLDTSWGEILINQKDIRNFQYAKSALFAAVMTLIDNSGIDPEKIKFYITGNFGTALNLKDSVEIGFFPSNLELISKSDTLFSGMKEFQNPGKVKKIRNNSRYISVINNILFNNLFLQYFELKSYEIN